MKKLNNWLWKSCYSSPTPAGAWSLRLGRVTQFLVQSNNLLSVCKSENTTQPGNSITSMCVHSWVWVWPPCSATLSWLTAPVRLYNGWSFLCARLYQHRMGMALSGRTVLISAARSHSRAHCPPSPFTLLPINSSLCWFSAHWQITLPHCLCRAVSQAGGAASCDLHPASWWGVRVQPVLSSWNDYDPQESRIKDSLMT